MLIGRITCLGTGKISRFLTYSRARTIQTFTLSSCLCTAFNNKNCHDRHRRMILTNDLSPLLEIFKRHKHDKRKNKQMEDEESDDDDEAKALAGDPHAKIISSHVSSMRVDLIIKACFGMARNKAEIALYDSKIRKNGQKVLKKSEQVRIGDFIDLIRGPSPKNPNFLLVSRITILTAGEQNDMIKIQFTRDKSLVIDNYEDEWQPVNA